jgi:hypothetical protein
MEADSRWKNALVLAVEHSKTNNSKANILNYKQA